MYQHADAVCEHCGEKFGKVVVQVHMGGSWRYLHEHCDREFAAAHGFAASQLSGPVSSTQPSMLTVPMGPPGAGSKTVASRPALPR